MRFSALPQAPVLVAAGLAGAGLTACGTASSGEPMADFKAQAIAASPLIREIAASNTFYFCSTHPEPNRYDALCEACDVNLFFDKDLPATANPDQDVPITGLKVFATHFYHAYKPWGDDPRPRISVSGERGTKTFRTKEVSVAAGRQLFEQANQWCRARQDGEFRVLKDEIDVQIGEGAR